MITLPVIVIALISVLIIVAGILLTQGKCAWLVKACMPKKIAYDWDRLLRFSGAATIVLGVCLLAAAWLLYRGMYTAARAAVWVVLALSILETVYEYKSPKFRK